MKSLNVNAYGVEELEYAEIHETDGGVWFLPFLAGAIAGGMVYDLINNFDGVCEAFNEGRAAARR